MNLKIIATKSAPEAVGPYSQAVSSGGFLYCSGQIPLNPATGELIGDSIENATRQSLYNLLAVLQAAELDASDVVKTTVLLTDMNAFAAMNAVYAEVFHTNPPARACFAVTGLPKGAIVEIEAIAKLRD